MSNLNKVKKLFYGTMFYGSLALVCAFAVNQSTVNVQAQSQNFCDNTGRLFGDVKVLGQVPFPGYPEGIAVKDGKAYVASGVSPFSTLLQDIPYPSNEQSMIYAYDVCNGQLKQQFVVNKNQRPFNPRAVSHVTFDGRGRLYVPEFQDGIFRLKLDAQNTQELYASKVADLKPCPGGVVIPGVACSPTLLDGRPIMNEMAFDAAGNLYLSDSNQATIWIIRPNGPLPRKPEIYFRSARFDAEGGFGTNGLRISPDRTKLFIAISQDGTTPRGARSGIYTLPLVSNPNTLTEADLKVFHLYPTQDLPDGIAFGSSGLLYVVLLNPLSLPPYFALPLNLSLPIGQIGPFLGGGISILDQNGIEINRISDTTMFDSPATPAFNGRGSIVVNNHAFLTGNRLKMQVLDVFVNDTESPLLKPNL